MRSRRRDNVVYMISIDGPLARGIQPAAVTASRVILITLFLPVQISSANPTPQSGIYLALQDRHPPRERDALGRRITETGSPLSDGLRGLQA